MPSPSFTHRKRLSDRAKDHIALANNTIPKHLQKSPSQKSSERMRQKFLTRAGIEKDLQNTPVMHDCFTCPRKPCGTHPNNCGEKMITRRCSICGQKVMFRPDPKLVWASCPSCREAKNG